MWLANHEDPAKDVQLGPKSTLSTFDARCRGAAVSTPALVYVQEETLLLTMAVERALHNL